MGFRLFMKSVTIYQRIRPYKFCGLGYKNQNKLSINRIILKKNINEIDTDC